jgi:hypothetical protein
MQELFYAIFFNDIPACGLLNGLIEAKVVLLDRLEPTYVAVSMRHNANVQRLVGIVIILIGQTFGNGREVTFFRFGGGGRRALGLLCRGFVAGI